MNDFDLAKGGDKEAFSKLIENVKLKLYKTGMSILRNDDDTCDALQETLISAYQNIKKLEHPEYFSTWIIRIMINKCYDIIKKNKKVTNINDKLKETADPYYEMYVNESELENVLKRLDTDLKMVTVLFYYDDLSVTEIAEVLNIPEGTVKSRLSRAREKISKIYQLEKGGEQIG